jgi:hypothetical protein
MKDKEQAMELLDRYLQAVKKHLPWERQDDIIAELKANLEAQLEEKEAALGRPLTSSEAEAWLKQLGSPLQMAAPYQTQQYLIGPAVFPTYRYVLQLACTWAAIIYCIVSVVKFAAEESPNPTAIFEAVLQLPSALFMTLAWVTLIFAVIEFAVAHSTAKWTPSAAPSASWSPGDLPLLVEKGFLGAKGRSFAKTVAEVIFGILFLAWWSLLPNYPFLWVGPVAPRLQALPYQFASACIKVYWWVFAVNVLQVAWHSVDLLRGTWQRPLPVKRMVLQAIGLIPLAVLLGIRDHAIVVLKHPALDRLRYGGTLEVINKGIYWAALVIFVIVVLQFASEIVKITLGNYRKRFAAMQ